MFAELQLNYILRQKEPRKIETALRLGLLPRDLNHAYNEIWDRVESEGSIDLAVKILSWIGSAQEPLTMAELQELLTVEPGDVTLERRYFIDPNTIVEVCNGLITVEQSSNVIKFAHSTVQTFLQSKQSTLWQADELAKILLTYLLFDVFREPAPDLTNLKVRTEEYRVSCYAATWWPHHVRGKGEHQSRDSAPNLSFVPIDRTCRIGTPTMRKSCSIPRRHNPSPFRRVSRPPLHLSDDSCRKVKFESSEFE